MFKTPLVVQADVQPDYWYLTSDLVWQDPIFGELIVPAGFKTDLESVPVTVRYLPFIDSVFNDDGVTRRPAAAHDFLYAWQAWGKDKSDLFLKTAIISEGGGRTAAYVVWLGVHLLGASSWHKDLNSLRNYNFTSDAAYQAWLAKQSPVSATPSAVLPTAGPVT